MADGRRDEVLDPDVLWAAIVTGALIIAAALQLKWPEKGPDGHWLALSGFVG